MGGLGVFSLIVLIILALAFVGLWLAIAILPGRIAKDRGHPQADAINICGWMGALTMGILAPLAFIWAYTRPVMKPIEALVPAEASDNNEPVDEEIDS